MKTARIKCPKCGKEGFAIPEDLEKTDLTYHCDQCGGAWGLLAAVSAVKAAFGCWWYEYGLK